MPNTQMTVTYFNPDTYIETLMEDIGFGNASEEQKEQMAKGLAEQLTHLILNAISLYVEPEQIDEALVRYGDLDDLAVFIEKLVEISPEAQLAIAETLENFYTEMVETYDYFKQT